MRFSATREYDASVVWKSAEIGHALLQISLRSTVCSVGSLRGAERENAVLEDGKYAPVSELMLKRD